MEPLALWATMGIYLSGCDLGSASSWEVACLLVSEGKQKWALRQGGLLFMVPHGYMLKPWEHFMVETQPSGWVEGAVEPRCWTRQKRF